MKKAKKQSAADESVPRKKPRSNRPKDPVKSKAGKASAAARKAKREKDEPITRQCSARRTNGEPCKNSAIRGGTVCARHGGSAPQVRAKANQRLIEMVLPAMRELHKIINRDDVADADKLRAIQMVLNRTGYNERQSIDIGLREPTPFDSLTSGDSPAFRIVRGRDAVVVGKDPAALESGDDAEQYAIDALRHANRAELDAASYLSDNDDADVVVGRVVGPDPAHPYPPGPIDWERRERQASRRPSEYGGRTGDPEDPWAAFERRVREGVEDRRR